MSFLLNAFLLGWSVSWPPGPVNAEMIRRGVLPRMKGGGFWPAWVVGIGACVGDFTWAFGVSLGAGVLLHGATVRRILAVVSIALLLFLAFFFAVSAWRIHTARRGCDDGSMVQPPPRGGFALGLMLALTSPWNLGFWFAVIAPQATLQANVPRSLEFAAAVVAGALTWTLVLCAAVQLGARIFVRPNWQIATQLLTAGVMIWFAARLILHFP
jgi:threonine/homoserine/homoserine lactone efflux protein